MDGDRTAHHAGHPGSDASEVAVTNLGVLVDALGLSLGELDSDRVAEITAAHPRGDFKNGFVKAFVDGLAHRPDTTYGTVNADVLERFVPGFQRGSMVDRIVDSAWAKLIAKNLVKTDPTTRDEHNSHDTCTCQQRRWAVLVRG